MYEFYFKDIYDEAILAVMDYSTDSGDYSKISKIIFNEKYFSRLKILVSEITISYPKGDEYMGIPGADLGVLGRTQLEK